MFLVEIRGELGEGKIAAVFEAKGKMLSKKLSKLSQFFPKTTVFSPKLLQNAVALPSAATAKIRKSLV